MAGNRRDGEALPGFEGADIQIQLLIIVLTSLHWHVFQARGKLRDQDLGQEPPVAKL